MNKKNLLIGASVIAVAIIILLITLSGGDPTGGHGHSH